MLSTRAFRARFSLVISAILAAVIALSSTASAVEPTAVAGSDVSPGGGSRAKYRFQGTEKCLMKHINRARARHGMRRLEWDRQLGFVARRHASSLANYRGVWHDGNLASEVTHWRRLGQNTGRSKRCDRIFRDFMRSPAHRSNIFGHWKFQGVGTSWSGGRLYVQHIFESRRNPGNVYRWP
jgi:uncharacterized protein YkwD